MADLLVCHLGRVPYEKGLEIQERLRERVQDGELGEVLLLLEHEPVYTLGRRSEPGDLPLGEDWCRAQGIDVVRTRRGGKLTYHGPGQLVGYPIMRVGDVPAFVRHDGGRDRRRARRGRRERAPALARGPRLHRRVDRNPPPSASSPRSASTSPAACPRTASRST